MSPCPILSLSKKEEDIITVFTLRELITSFISSFYGFSLEILPLFWKFAIFVLAFSSSIFLFISLAFSLFSQPFR